MYKNNFTNENEFDFLYETPDSLGNPYYPFKPNPCIPTIIDINGVEIV